MATDEKKRPLEVNHTSYPGETGYPDSNWDQFIYLFILWSNTHKSHLQTFTLKGVRS